MKRAIVTGCRGLVGTALCAELANRDYVVKPGDLPDCVLLATDFRNWVGTFAADWVVNLAAMTQVDECEKDAFTAFLANGLGASVVATEAQRQGARILQVSTDYVFDGLQKTPYREEDVPSPLSVYGMTKLSGEWGVLAHSPPEGALIVRGQSLYGVGRKSFPDSILRAASERSEIPVVMDQVVQPTWAHHFAVGLADLMDSNASGIVHLAASGSCTWNEFARAILEEAGVTTASIVPTTSKELGRPALRPPNSVFDLSKFERITSKRPRPWREQLRDYLRFTGRAA